jgi:hypothetical protein
MVVGRQPGKCDEDKHFWHKPLHLFTQGVLKHPGVGKELAQRPALLLRGILVRHASEKLLARHDRAQEGHHAAQANPDTSLPQGASSGTAHTTSSAIQWWITSTGWGSGSSITSRHRQSFLHLAQLCERLLETPSQLVILCPETLDVFLLVPGFPLTREVTSEHLPEKVASAHREWYQSRAILQAHSHAYASNGQPDRQNAQLGPGPMLR